MENNKIIILIPAFNELITLKKICKKIKKLNHNFIILDDCSIDKTSVWLKKKKIKFIKNKVNLGYEKNIINGIKYVLNKNKFKFLITFDADMEHKISDLKKAFKTISKNTDLVIFNRNKYNRWSEYILNYFFYRKFNLLDPLSGFKIYKISKLKKIIKYVESKYFLVDIVALFKSKDFKIRNILIKTQPRKNSKIGNSFKIHLKILKCIKFIF